MLVGVSPFSERLTMSNLISMVMAFLFLEALPSEESALRLGAIMKGIKLTKLSQNQKHVNPQQSKMALDA